MTVTARVSVVRNGTIWTGGPTPRSPIGNPRRVWGYDNARSVEEGRLRIRWLLDGHVGPCPSDAALSHSRDHGVLVDECTPGYIHDD